jgi:hypothetical protein
MLKNLKSSLKISGKRFFADELIGNNIKLNVTDSGDTYLYRRMEIENLSDADSLQITEPYTIDHNFDCKNTAFLHTLRGDDCSKNSFLPIDREINLGEEIVFTPIGGRPSNVTAFPYFDITLVQFGN